jgi:hypothetical protein
MATRHLSKPPFYEFLTDDDKGGYDSLRGSVASSDRRYNRNRRIATFQEMITIIRSYCESGESWDAWKRYLVCGICWGTHEIAINTRQLRLLLAKSKSSINGVFAKMGYESVALNTKESPDVLTKIPFLQANAHESRQWTVRRKEDEAEAARSDGEPEAVSIFDCDVNPTLEDFPISDGDDLMPKTVLDLTVEFNDDADRDKSRLEIGGPGSNEYELQ